MHGLYVVKDIDVSLRSHVESDGRRCSCCGVSCKGLFVAIPESEQANDQRHRRSTTSSGMGEGLRVEGACWSFGTPWSGSSLEDNKFIECFMKSGYESLAQDGVEHGESKGPLCNMTGDMWEAMPYPVIIDSGASASVIPEKWCSHVETKETEASRNGEHYTVANGGKCFNRAEKVITMRSKEGHLRNMKFTDVERVLGSASAVCKQGHTIVSDDLDYPDGSYIQHLACKRGNNGDQAQRRSRIGYTGVPTQ